MNALFLVFGATFGFLLARARVTDYDTMFAFFRFQDLHIGGVMAVAIAVAAVGLALLERSAGRAAIGCPIELGTKPMTRGLFAAAFVFGVGWALTGAWPGTALAQLGELKVAAIPTLLGITAGTYAFGWQRSRGSGGPR